MEEDGTGRRQVHQQKSRLKPESREKYNIRKGFLHRNLFAHTIGCHFLPSSLSLESDILCLLTNPGSSQLGLCPPEPIMAGSSFMANLEPLEPIWTRAEPARAHGLAQLEQARGKH